MAAPKVTVTARPYVITFHATGTTYPLTSEDAQRLLDEYPAVLATRHRVVLPGHNTADPKQRTTIRPATRGGGAAFIVEPAPDQRAQLQADIGAPLVHNVKRDHRTTR
jgi:hypothetical protein